MQSQNIQIYVDKELKSLEVKYFLLFSILQKLFLNIF